MRSHDILVRKLLLTIACPLVSWSAAAVTTVMYYGVRPEGTWVHRNIGAEFRGRALVAVRAGDLVAAVYQTAKDQTAPARLSVWEKGEERVLWDFPRRDGSLLFSRVTSPILVACIGRREKPDLILCFSENLGVGGGGERCRRQMLVFPQCDASKKVTISLSSMDCLDLGPDEEEDQIRYSSMTDFNAEAEIEKSIAIVKMPEEADIQVAVWSRTWRFKTAEEKRGPPTQEELVFCRIKESGEVDKYAENVEDIPGRAFREMSDPSAMLVR